MLSGINITSIGLLVFFLILGTIDAQHQNSQRNLDLAENPISTSQPDENPQVDLANNTLLPNNCGLDLSQRNINSDRAELDEFPWMALLEYQRPEGIITACTGALISKRYILTAAQCIKGAPSNWRLTSVRLGEYNTATKPDCVLQDDQNNTVCADDTISVDIEEQIAHEDFRLRSNDMRYDIALLRLSHDVSFTDYIKPICLPSNSLLDNRLFIAGWGRTEHENRSSIKRKVDLRLADKDQCNKTYGERGVHLGYGQICVGGENGKDACSGDSGGPLMSAEKIADGTSKWTAVGVVSFGPVHCGIQGWPSVYTRVIDFVPWIVNKLRP